MNLQDLDDLMLTEEFASDAEPVLSPVNPNLGRRKRRQNEPGRLLAWREHPAGGGNPYWRTGVVVEKAPAEQTVWVTPDDGPRAGEGAAVVVLDCRSDGTGQPYRRIGGPGDFRSTREWQTPAELRRAYVRVDRVVTTRGRRQIGLDTALHADPRCPTSDASRGRRVEMGVPRRVDDCPVYGRWLHDSARVPLDPNGPTGEYARFVPLCRRCLTPGEPE